MCENRFWFWTAGAGNDCNSGELAVKGLKRMTEREWGEGGETESRFVSTIFD